MTLNESFSSFPCHMVTYGIWLVVGELPCQKNMVESNFGNKHPQILDGSFVKGWTRTKWCEQNQETNHWATGQVQFGWPWCRAGTTAVFLPTAGDPAQCWKVEAKNNQSKSETQSFLGQYIMFFFFVCVVVSVLLFSRINLMFLRAVCLEDQILFLCLDMSSAVEALEDGGQFEVLQR